jgi:hypothetical protein
LVLQTASYPTQNASSISITSLPRHAVIERTGKGKEKATGSEVPKILLFPAFTYKDLGHETIQVKTSNKKCKTTSVTTYLSPQKDRGYGEAWTTGNRKKVSGSVGRPLWKGRY